MRTVVANLKGGTGKSTVAFNLALWILAQGRRALVADLDPQRTLSDVLEVREEEGYEPTLDHDHSLEAVPKDQASGYDEVLIDVGASDMEALLAAAGAADRVLIPVPPSQADVWSTYRFVQRILELRGTARAPKCWRFSIGPIRIRQCERPTRRSRRCGRLRGSRC